MMLIDPSFIERAVNERGSEVRRKNEPREEPWARAAVPHCTETMARKADPTIRGRLLVAARAEFSEHGLDGALMGNITGRAGVSKGAFYLHFRSKEDAFEEVANEFFAVFWRHLDGMEELLESETEPGEVFSELLRRDLSMLEFLWSERAFGQVLFEGARSPRHRHLIEAFAARIQERVERFLTIDQSRGRLLPGVDVKTLAAFVAGGFDRYARVLLVSEQKPDIERDLRGFHEFICRGCATPEHQDLLGFIEPGEAEHPESPHGSSSHKETPSARPPTSPSPRHDQERKA